ncbi:PEP-CTERM sorting domain-containing protein [Microvirga sp. SRT01]|uniref:PEP-CTERM sorting domain-containing protein n=1 Tax=Sphingomonas longa TaxID=2778730 RepID=A0ABS2DB71_9SPHN|nr:PEP-CTERM sorting domain-containing protein [Sphingomonas sp. BT552]MBR7710785.1 PEP-CTERM sorting domain-containing protein [Microvirga sp. SRT01]
MCSCFDSTNSNAGIGAVPEPSTWAMMIVGFGMVGGAMRRRRVSTKVSFA